MGGPNSLSDRNPAKTDVFTNSCSEPKNLILTLQVQEPTPHIRCLKSQL
jgi:hypothetical protein